jgi:hypothetical protein
MLVGHYFPVVEGFWILCVNTRIYECLITIVMI